MANSIFGILIRNNPIFSVAYHNGQNNEGKPMSDSKPKTNPMDDYENGLITFEELYAIILAMPQRELTDEDREYYWELAGKAERGEFEIPADAKIYRGEDAAKRGRDLIRRALEPQEIVS